MFVDESSNLDELSLKILKKILMQIYTIGETIYKFEKQVIYGQDKGMGIFRPSFEIFNNIEQISLREDIDMLYQTYFSIICRILFRDVNLFMVSELLINKTMELG